MRDRHGGWHGTKDLLVHLEDSELSRARAKLGIALARAHGAHLTGFYVAAETRIPPELTVTIQEDILALERAASEATARRINAEFARAARDAGVGVETRISHIDWMHIQDVVTERVRHVDLAILGQPDPERGSPVGRAVIEAAFLETGRPALSYLLSAPAKRLARRCSWPGTVGARRRARSMTPCHFWSAPIA